MAIHSDLAAGRWQTMTLAEQLGNIGAEVGRAIRAKAADDPRRLDGALTRALELFDLSLDDPRWRGSRVREIARAREVTCDFLAGDNTYGSTAEWLEAYFTEFALLARRGR
jgi:hypothetical protein